MKGNKYCYYDIFRFAELYVLFSLYPNIDMFLLISLILFNSYPRRREAEGGGRPAQAPDHQPESQGMTQSPQGMTQGPRGGLPIPPSFFDDICVHPAYT